MLGEYLKNYRINNCVSQTEMAKQLNINKCYYSLIENNKRLPGINLMKRIALLLNMKPIELRGIANENN